jgi:hypothetical protein
MVGIILCKADVDFLTGSSHGGWCHAQTTVSLGNSNHQYYTCHSGSYSPYYEYNSEDCFQGLFVTSPFSLSPASPATSSVNNSYTSVAYRCGSIALGKLGEDSHSLADQTMGPNTTRWRPSLLSTLQVRARMQLLLLSIGKITRLGRAKLRQEDGGVLSSEQVLSRRGREIILTGGARTQILHFLAGRRQ